MKKLLICAFALAGLWACTSSDSEEVKPSQAGDVYMKFSVKMETTRSQTDESGDTNSNADPDYEVGKDVENKISSVDIVLVGTDGEIKAEGVALTAAATDTYVASFESTALVGGQTYTVYIVANGTFVDVENVTEVGADVTTTIAKPNYFLMTNANEAQYNVAKLPDDLTIYNTPQNPYNLGAYEVERAAARFDYKAAKTDNIYTLCEDADENATVNIQLTEAALINMSKKFYDFRRVSADGTATNAVIGGVETPNNFVVDTDHAAKAAGYTDAQAANFHNHMSTNTWSSWKSFANLEDDNWKGNAAEGETALDGYQIWQYASENTIPNINAQQHGITTGIVFKGKLIATDKAPQAVQSAFSAENKEMIYVFKEVLYGTWADVKAAAEAKNNDATVSPVNPELAAAYNAVVAAGETVAAKAANGFTGYAPATDGNYYAYYYYWNRHNDNGEPYEMGKMEFAVVRNNVYKLCVENITKFGHPTPGDPNSPDPDPEDPTDPDESENYYFTVTVKVLPWVVRINNIEF
ncbi:MAG: Mfa1 family fimbria major subunit [Rikenellaceae bacterium]|nr:Mfa1 family fimbria major subunit [Rikenellaceae bacterium]